jgi:hypothetical protein
VYEIHHEHEVIPKLEGLDLNNVDSLGWCYRQRTSILVVAILSPTVSAFRHNFRQM